MALIDRLEEAKALEGWTQHFGLRWTLGDCAVTSEQLRLQEAGTREGWQWIYTPNSHIGTSWAFLTLDSMFKFRSERMV